MITPTAVVSEIAKFRIWAGTRRATAAKAGGKNRTAAAACTKMKAGVSVGPGYSPRQRVSTPVVVRQSRRAHRSPIRSDSQPAKKSTAKQERREVPVMR